MLRVELTVNVKRRRAPERRLFIAGINFAEADLRKNRSRAALDPARAQA
jgi:hypothetical protein